MPFQIKPVGNCSIVINANGKKEPHFPKGSSWKSPIIDKKLNGSFIVPNGDYIILDIDNVESSQNLYIMENFQDKCKYIVKTFKKGYHLYFKHCAEIAHINKLPELDIVSSGKKMLFCPPTAIEDLDGTVRKYQLIANEEPQEMPKELVNYILNRVDEIKNNTIKLHKDSETLITKATKKAEPAKVVKEFSGLVSNVSIIEEILENLNHERADDYNEWIKVMMILKNEGYKYEIFETFSKRSSKFDDSVVSIWNNYKPSDVKNKLTIASLWMMLKEDNTDAFNKINLKDSFKDYKFNDYKPNGSFSSAEFIRLFNEDKKLLKSKIFVDDDMYSLTNSFKYFSAHHFKIPNISYVNVSYDEGVKKINVLSKDYINNFTECHIEHKSQCVYFSTLFEKNSHKQVFDTVSFEPNSDNKSIFNLFSGFKYANANPIEYNYSVIEEYINMIKHIIDNEEQSNHFFDWLAHIIQKPQIKQTHCYVFYSFIHGVGKNTIVEGIRNVLSGYYYKLKNAEELTAKFNAEKIGKLFCYGDEIKSFKQGESVMNEVKNVITQNEQSIEYKGKDKMTGIQDYCHYLFTTNNKRNFLIEQSDRRFNMVKCNNVLYNNGDFTSIYEKVNTKEFGKNLYLFLMKRDLTNYNAFKATTNLYKKELENYTLPPEIKALCRIKNTLIGNYVYWEQIYDEVKGHCMLEGKKAIGSKELRDLLSVNYNFTISRRRVNGVLDAKIGMSFIESNKIGDSNIKILKSLMDEKEDDENIDDENIVIYDE